MIISVDIWMNPPTCLYFIIFKINVRTNSLYYQKSCNHFNFAATFQYFKSTFYQSEEDDSGDTDDSAEEAGDDSEYEYEETYTLTEWFPPDFWRSKLESAKQMSITTAVNDDRVNVANPEDEDAQDEYYYHLLKSKITAAQNVVVTDVTVNNSTIMFKVFCVSFQRQKQYHVL